MVCVVKVLSVRNSAQSPGLDGEVRMVDVVTASSGLANTNISFSTFDKSREEYISQFSEKVILSGKELTLSPPPEPNIILSESVK